MSLLYLYRKGTTSLSAYKVFHIIEFCIKIIKLLHLYILCSDRVIKIIDKKLQNLSNLLWV